MNEIGRESVSFFEIDVPRCSRTYGVAPCAAVLGTTGQQKCFNARKTCQDPANLSLTETVTLRFAKPQEGLLAYGPVIPALVSISTAPLAVNLGGMEKSASALGQREVVTVKLNDFLHSDHQLDKYRLERESGAAQADGIGYLPYERGTFWGRFLARNPYYASFTCRVREGYIGDALADMRVRSYIIDTIAGPNDGSVTVKAKDLFSLIEKRKARAPLPSTGELLADLTGSPASFTLSPAGIGDLEYPASGHVAIGREIIQFTRVGDVMTIVARGQLGTTAEDHKQDDVVQLVLSYSVQAPHDVIYDLLVNYSQVPAAQIPKSDWDMRMATNADFYTAHIAQPTAVADLIGEICEQASITVWPDVESGQVDLRPLRAGAALATLDDDADFIDGSLTLARADDKRVSQVWVYYGQINPLEDQQDPNNYHSRLVIETGTADFYGSESVREIWSRWIPQGGRTFATHTGNRIATLFQDPPLQASFALAVTRAADIALAGYVVLQPLELQDFTGAQAGITHAITEIERSEDDVTFKAQSVAFVADEDSVRRIYLENDGLRNVNLRTAHDALFPAPTGAEAVEFIIPAGVIVGSTTASVAAIVRGDWPSMTTPLKLTVAGRIQGVGGLGGPGAAAGSGDGLDGGDALDATSGPIEVDNTGGEIWAGGGGGAGGVPYWSGNFSEPVEGGGGGGGGAGTDGGTGGDGGGLMAPYLGSTGQSGTSAAGGSGGAQAPGGGARGVAGAAGGGPGLAGSDSAVQTQGVFNSTFAPPGKNFGGASGRYIVGNANITWLGSGDRRGGVA